MTKVAKKTEQDVTIFPEWTKLALWLLRSFGELKWLKAIKNFILEFVVQASEILVILALVLSMVNFLTGGHLVESLPWLGDLWAWLQGIAIDAGFGVVLINFLDNIKKDTWVQCIIYGILTALLGFNAGAVTYIDSLASAAHLAMTNPNVNPFPLWVLALTRSIAVVGFLAVSRIHSYDFTRLPAPSLSSLIKKVNVDVSQITEIKTVEEAKQIVAADTEAIKQVREESDAKITEIRNDENEAEGDDQTTTIVMPEFTEKRKPNILRKVVEVKNGGKSKVAESIIQAMKDLQEAGEAVTDEAIAKKIGKSRHTVIRNKPRP